MIRYLKVASIVALTSGGIALAVTRLRRLRHDIRVLNDVDTGSVW